MEGLTSQTEDTSCFLMASRSKCVLKTQNGWNFGKRCRSYSDASACLYFFCVCVKSPSESLTKLCLMLSVIHQGNQACMRPVPFHGSFHFCLKNGGRIELNFEAFQLMSAHSAPLRHLKLCFYFASPSALGCPLVRIIFSIGLECTGFIIRTWNLNWSRPSQE